MREKDLLPNLETEIVCPECGQALSGRDDVFTVKNGDTVLGCSLCLHAHNAAEWFWGQQEAAE